jgi:radical SAM protein with 4Fe4S-binding SPASM domain
MIASDMMALDGSGEYTGCYFFTNNKMGLQQAVLGNIFEDKVYIDNYKHWIDAYNAFFDNDTCNSCNIRGLCYSCPAGNLTVFGKPYSNYKACAEITEFHVKLKAFQNEARFELLVTEVSEELSEGTLAVRVVQLEHKFKHGTIYMKEDIRKDGYPELDVALSNLEGTMCNTRTDNQIINIYNSLRTSGLRGAEHLPSSLTDISEGFKPQLIYVISALEMMLFNKWSDTNENNEITL